MSQYLCVSGSSARSMSLDSCLSIHVYLRILCKSHAAGSIAQQPYESQDPLQDPRLRIHVSASLYLTDSLQDPRLRIHVSASLYSQEPLQDPCLRIHVSDLCLSIHQNGSSARSMSPDSYLSIFVSQAPLQDPCLRSRIKASICISGSSARSMSPDPYISSHMYLRLLCKIHVSGFMSQHPYVSQEPLQDPCLRIRKQASICISGSSARSMSPIRT